MNPVLRKRPKVDVDLRPHRSKLVMPTRRVVRDLRVYYGRARTVAP